MKDKVLIRDQTRHHTTKPPENTRKTTIPNASSTQTLILSMKTLKKPLNLNEKHDNYNRTISKPSLHFPTRVPKGFPARI